MSTVTHFSGALPGISDTNFLANASASYLTPNVSIISTIVEPVLTPRYCPIRLQRAFRILSVACNVTVVGTDATEITHFGIYRHNNSIAGPDLLIRDLGTVQSAVGGTGVKEITAAQPLVLGPDVYWICSIVASAGTVGTKQSFSGTSSFMIQKSSPIPGSTCGYTGPAQADTTMPPVANLTGSTGSMPRLSMKGVAL